MEKLADKFLKNKNYFQDENCPEDSLFVWLWL